MHDQVNNYQCPACTGPLHFAGDSGKLECEYCGSSYTVSEVEALYREKEKKAAEACEKQEQQKSEQEEANRASGEESGSMPEEWGEEAAGLRTFGCPSCGAELVCDATTAATSCPYCGNPQVIPGTFKGGYKPEFVIPFKLDKEAAIAALKKHYKGKFLLPKAFTAQNHIEEIKGVYVPFWLFDGEAYGDITYHTTRSRTYTSGDYRITETDHYVVERAGSYSFSSVPADASSKMPDDYMDSIEPYNYDELKEFSTAYLPGYLADVYDVSMEECRERVYARARQSSADLLRGTVTGYESCTEREKDIQITPGEVHYALMPVWMLSTKWNGQSFLFAMNGQTGRLVGNLPIDKGRLFALFAGVAAPLAAIMALIML